MRQILLGLMATTLVAGCAVNDGRAPLHSEWSRYDYNHPDPGYGGYEANRYYREDARRYQERQLSNNDRLYRGRDGQYYCRRSDGSTGLVVGAIAGGVLGDVIAPGGSEAVGVVLGAVLGGAAGRAVDRSRGVRCR